MKKILALVVILSMSFTFMACGGANQTNQEKPAWTISVEGVKDSATEFTSVDFGKLSTVDIDATLKKKDGSEQKQKFTGVPFTKVLESLGVKDYSKVTVEAKDAYSKDYTSDLINAEGTILAVKADGKDLASDSGPVELVVSSQSGNMWIKCVAKIKVAK